MVPGRGMLKGKPGSKLAVKRPRQRAARGINEPDRSRKGRARMGHAPLTAGPSHLLPTLVRVPCAFHGCRLVAMYTKLGGLNDDARKAGFSHTDLLNG
jgi:hypothetical protein